METQLCNLRWVTTTDSDATLEECAHAVVDVANTFSQRVMWVHGSVGMVIGPGKTWQQVFDAYRCNLRFQVLMAEQGIKMAMRVGDTIRWQINGIYIMVSPTDTSVDVLKKIKHTPS